MKKRFYLLFVFLGVAVAGFWLASNGRQPLLEPTDRPKLVVGVVVDQMRWDYLYRFQDRYGPGGFKRLLREGFACESTYINYVPAVTSIGHASIYTGSVPAIHGICGNEIIVRDSGKPEYCIFDPETKPVGGIGFFSFSPRNLLANTITDELKLATNFRSKVIGISLKDRGAILPAGHSADAAYWFDDKSGRWGTSTYYMDKVPEWVDRFNAAGHARKYAGESWALLHSPETYTQSIAGTPTYERSPSPEVSGTFPLNLAQFKSNPYGGVRISPFGNTLTLDFARAAIEAERMGQGPDTDFLCVSLSSTDAAGHIFGTNSPKMEDMYLRLDREMSDFLSWLDEKLGKGNYLLFLTADHGAGHTAALLTDHKIPAGVWPVKDNVAKLNEVLEAKYKVPGIVSAVNNYRVYLDEELVAQHNLDTTALRADCVRQLLTMEGVAFALDLDNAVGAVMPAQLREQIINGYYPDRCGPIQIVLKPGWYIGDPLGTTHGAWNPYDTHIPLVWMGWGIKPGRSGRKVSITDIAPTLAALLNIQKPNGSIGDPIPEVLEHSSFSKP